MSRKTRAARRVKPAKEHHLTFKSGRKFAIADAESAKRVLGGLGAIMATWKECAAVLQISEATMHRLFLRWPDVKDAYDSGKCGGLVGLRRSQFKLADRNATMGIFLGMNYLGQKDMRNTHLSGEVKHSHEHSIIGMLLKEIDEESRGAPLIEHQPSKEQAA
jgi:hypothetical protein